jgi:urease accessory protein
MTFATTFRRSVAAIGLTALATPALAHTGHGGAADFVSGFMHPLLGLDHVLAMLAVGVLGARQGGRAMLAIPAGFLGAMLAGGVAGFAGLGLPLVELGILGSIVVLGLAIVFAERLPAAAAVVLAAAFGLFHGHAHGGEMATDAVFASVAAGFVFATALLHVAGSAIARLPMPAIRGFDFARASGVAFSLAGVALFLG